MSQPTSGGVAICVRDQTRAALEAGYEVRVASPDGDDGHLAGWVREAGATHLSLEMRRAPGPADIGQIIKLRRLIRWADIVHLHSSKAGALGRAAALTVRREARPPIVFTPHAWSWLVGGRLAGIYKLVERMLAHRTDCTIAVSQAEADAGRDTLGRRSRIEVINNGVDLARFAPSGPVAPRDESPLVVCVGRFAEQKGQDLAIRSIAMSSTAGIRLRLVGDGELEQPLRDLAKSLEISDQIEWAGPADDPSPHMRAADVVLIPSRWDGQSLVLLEAMATGSAIVATDVGGTEVADGVATIVPNGDTKAMAAAVDSLLADDAERTTLGVSAADRAMDFGLERSLNATLAIWEELSGR